MSALEDENDEYSLPALLKRNRNDPLHRALDIASGLTFAQYVLNWYYQQKKMGK